MRMLSKGYQRKRENAQSEFLEQRHRQSQQNIGINYKTQVQKQKRLI